MFSARSHIVSTIILSHFHIKQCTNIFLTCSEESKNILSPISNVVYARKQFGDSAFNYWKQQMLERIVSVSEMHQSEQLDSRYLSILVLFSDVC